METTLVVYERDALSEGARCTLEVQKTGRKDKKVRAGGRNCRKSFTFVRSIIENGREDANNDRRTDDAGSTGCGGHAGCPCGGAQAQCAGAHCRVDGAPAVVHDCAGGGGRVPRWHTAVRAERAGARRRESVREPLGADGLRRPFEEPPPEFPAAPLRRQHRGLRRRRHAVAGRAYAATPARAAAVARRGRRGGGGTRRREPRYSRIGRRHARQGQGRTHRRPPTLVEAALCCAHRMGDSARARRGC